MVLLLMLGHRHCYETLNANHPMETSGIGDLLILDVVACTIMDVATTNMAIQGKYRAHVLLKRKKMVRASKLGKKKPDVGFYDIQQEEMDNFYISWGTLSEHCYSKNYLLKNSLEILFVYFSSQIILYQILISDS